jgi:hypothetical protein
LFFWSTVFPWCHLLNSYWMPTVVWPALARGRGQLQSAELVVRVRETLTTALRALGVVWDSGEMLLLSLPPTPPGGPVEQESAQSIWRCAPGIWPGI